jgi:hypothetical protein
MVRGRAARRLHPRRSASLGGELAGDAVHCSERIPAVLVRIGMPPPQPCASRAAGLGPALRRLPPLTCSSLPQSRADQAVRTRDVSATSPAEPRQPVRIGPFQASDAALPRRAGDKNTHRSPSRDDDQCRRLASPSHPTEQQRPNETQEEIERQRSMGASTLGIPARSDLPITRAAGVVLGGVRRAGKPSDASLNAR